jgi:hypothetical protein
LPASGKHGETGTVGPGDGAAGGVSLAGGGVSTGPVGVSTIVSEGEIAVVAMGEGVAPGAIWSQATAARSRRMSRKDLCNLNTFAGNHRSTQVAKTMEFSRSI